MKVYKFLAILNKKLNFLNKSEKSVEKRKKNAGKFFESPPNLVNEALGEFVDFIGEKLTGFFVVFPQFGHLADFWVHHLKPGG